VKTYTVYRICDVTRLKVPIVRLGERRRQERGSNDADMMRLARQLCAGTTGNLPYLIVVSDNGGTPEDRPRTGPGAFSRAHP
jgi:hypothetical protein